MCSDCIPAGGCGPTSGPAVIAPVATGCVPPPKLSVQAARPCIATTPRISASTSSTRCRRVRTLSSPCTWPTIASVRITSSATATGGLRPEMCACGRPAKGSPRVLGATRRSTATGTRRQPGRGRTGLSQPGPGRWALLHRSAPAHAGAPEGDGRPDADQGRWEQMMGSAGMGLFWLWPLLIVVGLGLLGYPGRRARAAGRLAPATHPLHHSHRPHRLPLPHPRPRGCGHDGQAR
jgi:hypothetical protein